MKNYLPPTHRYFSEATRGTVIKYKNLRLRPKMVAMMVLLNAELERPFKTTSQLATLVGTSHKHAGSMLEAMRESRLVRRQELSEFDPQLVWKLTEEGEQWLSDHE